MIQIYPLLADFYVHLHCYMLKSVNVTLAYILQIMVAHNQIYLSVQPVKDFTPFGRTAKTEITQVKHDIILPDYVVPIGIIVSFIISTSLNGLLQKRMIFP